MRGRGLLLGVLLALAAAAPAHAVESVLMDDDLLLHEGPERADATVRELAGLGVDRVRLTVNWSAVAPGLAGAPEPGRLAPHDHAVRALRRAGLEVLVTVQGGQGTTRPDPARFGRFVEALGRRWDGREGRPRVSAWSLWNEPNWGGHLQPQWVKVAVKPRRAAPRRGRRAGGRAAAGRRRARPRPRTRWVARSARIYRALHRAGAAGLAASGHGGDTILLGETAPRGVTRRGTTRPTGPVAFLADLLCLHRRTLRPLTGGAAREQGCADFARRGPLPATGYAHHPYGVRDAPGTPARRREDAGLADAARLTAVLDAGAAAGRVAARLPLWWTEHGYETPPDPRRGIDPELHARWLADAERLARSTPRVVALTQFLLRDDAPDARFPASDPRHWRTYQSGLRTADGTPKPALAAWRLPLSVPARVAAGAPVPVWGMVRPPADATGQRAVVEFAPDGSDAWSVVAEPELAGRDGVLALRLASLPGSGRLRLTWRPPPPPRPPRDDSPAGALRPAPAPPPPPAPVHGHPVHVAVG